MYGHWAGMWIWFVLLFASFSCNFWISGVSLMGLEDLFGEGFWGPISIQWQNTFFGGSSVFLLWKLESEERWGGGGHGAYDWCKVEGFVDVMMAAGPLIQCSLKQILGAHLIIKYQKRYSFFINFLLFGRLKFSQAMQGFWDPWFSLKLSCRSIPGSGFWNSFLVWLSLLTTTVVFPLSCLLSQNYMMMCIPFFWVPPQCLVNVKGPLRKWIWSRF